MVRHGRPRDVRHPDDLRGLTLLAQNEARLGNSVAAKTAQAHLIEVKGTSDDTMNFQLTPNEYKMLQEHHADYRVCVVLDALERPQLYELAPKKQRDGWILTSTDGPSIKVRLEERTAAVGVEVPT